MRVNPRVARVLSAVVAVAVVVLVALLGLRGGDSGDTGTAASASGTAAVAQTVTGKSGATSSRAAAVPVDSPTRAPGVPDRAYVTLVEIDAGRWPGSANAPGTKGGEQWMNRGGDLPRADADGRAITYREWDVNPKERNRSRDAERIVTGSDGTAWYTGDHYETFTRMR